MTGPDGKGLTINGKYDEMRSALLGPGEYIGGGFNLRDVFPDMKKPGNYRIEWSVAVTINGNEQVIAAGAVVIEILGPKKGD